MTTETFPVSAAAAGPKPISCPACGNINAPDSVFCQMCDHSLGEFKYVQEEIIADASPHERLAQRVTDAIGRPHFLVVHLLWITVWVVVNTGVFAFLRQFDNYPFSLLGLTLTAEAIFITGFILITQNRQNAYASKRAELDYEVSVKTYRRIIEMEAMLHTALHRLEAVERQQEKQR